MDWDEFVTRGDQRRASRNRVTWLDWATTITALLLWAAVTVMLTWGLTG